MNSRKISNTLTLCILLFTPILYAASGENGSNAGFSIFGNGKDGDNGKDGEHGGNGGFSIFGNGGHGGNGGDAD